MEIIKRNMVSIISGVVALLAVVFVTVWPMPGWFEDLREKLEATRSDYMALQELNSSTFTKPIVDPAQKEGEDLGQFPNERTIEAGIRVMEELKKQADAAMKTAAEMNRHDPLVPEALPTKKTGYAWTMFKIQYYKKLQELTDMMRAVAAPTDMEIQDEMRRLQDEYDKKVTRSGGMEAGRELVEAALMRKLETLPEEMRRTRAKQYAVFISPGETMNTCVGNLPAPDSPEMPNVEQIWAAQVALWIQEDVVKAIAETNGPNSSVETSIVKRLVRWDIPKQYVTSAGPVDITTAGALGGFSSEGASVAEASADAKEYSVSVTGRVTNPLYDVMHFKVVVDVDAMRFRTFMANLTKNQFITILRADMIGVDRDREQARGYIYGSNPVVRLALHCEIIFFRNWTKPLMPESIRQALMIPADEPVQGGGTPVAGL